MAGSDVGTTVAALRETLNASLTAAAQRLAERVDAQDLALQTALAEKASLEAAVARLNETVAQQQAELARQAELHEGSVARLRQQLDEEAERRVGGETQHHLAMRAQVEGELAALRTEWAAATKTVAGALVRRAGEMSVAMTQLESGIADRLAELQAQVDKCVQLTDDVQVAVMSTQDSSGPAPAPRPAAPEAVPEPAPEPAHEPAHEPAEPVVQQSVMLDSQTGSPGSSPHVPAEKSSPRRQQEQQHVEAEEDNKQTSNKRALEDDRQEVSTLSPSAKKPAHKFVILLTGFDRSDERSIAHRDLLASYVVQLGGELRFCGYVLIWFFMIIFLRCSENEDYNEITHLVAPSGTKSPKTMAAILHRRWILPTKWLEESKAQGAFVSEASYGFLCTERTFLYEQKVFFTPDSKSDEHRKLLVGMASGTTVNSRDLADIVVIGPKEERIKDSKIQMSWRKVMEHMPNKCAVP